MEHEYSEDYDEEFFQLVQLAEMQEFIEKRLRELPIADNLETALRIEQSIERIRDTINPRRFDVGIVGNGHYRRLYVEPGRAHRVVETTD